MKRKFKKVIKLLIIIVLIIRIINCIYVYNFKYKEWKNKSIDVHILDVNKVEEDKIEYKVKFNKDTFLLDIKDTNKKYKAGDKLTIISSNYELKKYNNPYEFDYKLYLNSNKIVSKIYCIKILKEYKCNNLFLNCINYIRDNISSKLDGKLSNINSNMIKSLMYGEHKFLNKDIKQKFVNIGLGHMLCISGTHLICLISTFEKITSSKKKIFLNLMIITYFYFISLFNISLLRAIIMYLLSIINNKINFKIKYLLTLFFILILNPYYIFNIGIIFSFLSVLSIKLFNDTITSWLEIKIKMKSKVVKYIILNISLTLSAQILIIPFQLYYFQKLTLMSVFSNTFISFILNILMYSIFSLFILFFIPILSDLLILICDKLICLIIFQVNLLDNLNYLNITVPKPNFIVFICFYLTIIFYLYQKHIIIYFWNYRRKVRLYIKIIRIICVIVILFWYMYTMYFETYVIYFNVGQGNMALIHRYTKNIIVDIGSTQNIAGNIMNNFFKAKNINKIDMILITHMHSDHMNGIENLIKNNIKIQSVCYSIPYTKVDECNKLEKLLKDNKIGIIKLKENDNIKIYDINIDILAPPINYYIKDNDMLNANSTVYLITIINKNYLFLGDSTKNTEQYILKAYLNNDKNVEIKEKLKNIYVYQVAHHGSNTSSSESFVNELNIKNAIFSAQKSVYGHPSEKVIEIFNNLNCKLFLTEKNGAIVF